MAIASGGICCHFLWRGRSANTFRQASQTSSFQNNAPVIMLPILLTGDAAAW
jgi:hypothetical protein